MVISAIGNVMSNQSFKARPVSKEYENPINRKTERNIAILGTVGASALVGGSAGLLSTCFKQGGKLPYIVGAAAGLLTLFLSLPSALYDTKVRAFTKEKEMDVFSRQKDAQKNIYADINNEIKDENISLDQKIKHYTTVKMADSGKGVMIKGA